MSSVRNFVKKKYSKSTKSRKKPSNKLADLVPSLQTKSTKSTKLPKLPSSNTSVYGDYLAEMKKPQLKKSQSYDSGIRDLHSGRMLTDIAEILTFPINTRIGYILNTTYKNKPIKCKSAFIKSQYINRKSQIMVVVRVGKCTYHIDILKFKSVFVFRDQMQITTSKEKIINLAKSRLRSKSLTSYSSNKYRLPLYPV